MGKLTGEQRLSLEKVENAQEHAVHTFMEYWHRFSDFHTWQFWLHMAMLVVPLICVFILIDRKKALQIGFYGFNVHVWFTYIDTIGVRNSLWVYPFQAIPFIPVSFGLDAALIPVLFMLVYQWSINEKKNYYLCSIGLSLILSFIIKPIFVAMDLLVLMKGMNYFHLFLGYIIVLLLSKWIANLFLYMQKKSKATV